jgi:hypothetical protein
VIALWLLAGHMVGDFILATRWQAATKFDDGLARTRHVLGYCVPFAPIFLAYASWGRAAAGLAALFALHWLTDCRRYRSTLGDAVGWYLVVKRKWAEPPDSLPPNPWEPIALFIDQGLHVLQLAVVGTLFLT